MLFVFWVLGYVSVISIASYISNKNKEALTDKLFIFVIFSSVLLWPVYLGTFLGELFYERFK